ncbi:MAG TPA: hypothetical protein VKS24_14625 [Bradyrhizobium sp.]|nr:hypothetical protein [Bradyrhizobium sp.]
MGLFLLDVIFRAFEIRGHVPGHDDFPERPVRSSSLSDGWSGRLMWILAIGAAITFVLSLVLWASA